MRRKKKKGAILLAIFADLLSLAFAELIFRLVLFSSNPAFKNLRKPGDFASEMKDEYWKLSYDFKYGLPPPEEPHPLLGWMGYFMRRSFMHWEIEDAGEKRPVLLFGDSFAMCMKQSVCFDKILNSDSAFSKSHYLLNYGVGGYGTDQIYLLMQKVIPHYSDPFIVLTFLTSDIERCALSVRTGQKPWFEIKNDSLVLRGTPVAQKPDSFFTANPPGIFSYLWRRFVFSRFNKFPQSWRKNWRGESEAEQKIREVNAVLFREMIQYLNESSLNFMVLVFETIEEVDGKENNWRTKFIADEFRRNKQPVIWSGELIRNHTNYTNSGSDPYFIRSDGHPTTLQNEIVSAEILNQIQLSEQQFPWNPDTSSPVVFSNQLRNGARKILNDPVMREKTLLKASDKQISLEKAARKYAEYLIEDGIRD